MTMKKGLVIYDALDGEKNRFFIDWLISEAHKKDLVINYMSYQDWLSSAIEFEKLKALDFVINRTRDDVLSLNLELAGIRVFNNAEVSKVGNHKLWGYHYAKRHDFPYMPVVIRGMGTNEENILKPVDGHGGQNVFLYDQSDHAGGYWQKLCNQEKKKYMFQEKLEHMVGDLRCYIIGGEIIHAVLRKKTQDCLITNYSKGAPIELFTLPSQMKKRIEVFIAPLAIDYAGIDFLIDEAGQYYFNEIEDVVGSRMLSALNINDTVPRFIRHIKNKL